MGIIAVVVGHSPAPHELTMFISAFHMPLFFYLSGWFFKEQNIYDWRGFIARKIQGVYWQYLKWVLPVLWLHNVFLYIGFYSTTHGWIGGTTYLSFREMAIRTLTNIFFMTGSDTLTGGVWFLKDLFYGSLLVLLLTKTSKELFRLSFGTSMATTTAACAIMAFMWSFFDIQIKYVSWIISPDLFLASGMIAAGFLFRTYCRELQTTKRWIATSLFIATGLVLWFAATNMEGLNIFRPYNYMPEFITTSILGLVMTMSLSSVINGCDNKMRSLLCYMGRHTLTIFLMHFMCFKLVNLLIIFCYDLDYSTMGALVINGYEYTWLLYSFVGTALPLLAYRIWELHFKRYNIDMTVYPWIELFVRKGEHKPH